MDVKGMSTVGMVTYIRMCCWVGVHSSMVPHRKHMRETHYLEVALSRKLPGGVPVESVVVGHQHGDWGVELGVGS